VLLTAENPYSQQLSNKQNKERTKVLGDYLALEGFSSYKAAGLSTSGKPSERYYLIANIELEKAEYLGCLFHQYALIHGEVGRPAEIHFCGQEHRHS
jgi:hypothetical protein